MKKSVKILLVILGVAILGGGAYMLSSGNLFKGFTSYNLQPTLQTSEPSSTTRLKVPTIYKAPTKYNFPIFIGPSQPKESEPDQVSFYENTGFSDGGYDAPKGILGGKEVKIGSFVIEGAPKSYSSIDQIVISDDFDSANYNGAGNNIEAQGHITSESREVVDGLTLAQVRATSIGDQLSLYELGGNHSGRCESFTVTAKQENGSNSSITGTAQCSSDFADNDDISITDKTTTSMADLFENIKIVKNSDQSQIGETVGTLTDEKNSSYTFVPDEKIYLRPSKTMVVDIYADIKTDISLFNYNNDYNGLFTPTAVKATALSGVDTSGSKSDLSMQYIYLAKSGEITVSAESRPRASQFQMGDLNVELARFRFTAGLAEPVSIRKVVLDNLAGSTNIYNLTLSDADSGETLGVLSTIDYTHYDGVVNLDKNWTIPKGGSKTMVVTGSISGFDGAVGAVEDRDTDLQLQVLHRDGENSNGSLAFGTTSGVEIYFGIKNAVASKHFVYRTTLSGQLNSKTPVGNQAPSAEQKVLSIDLTAGSKKEATFRQGLELGTCLGGAGSPTITVAHGDTAAKEIQGSACEFTAINSANDSVAYLVGAGTLDDYSYVSFWFSENDGGAGTMSDFTDWSIVTDTDATGAIAPNNTTALAASHCNAGSVTQMVDDVWYHCVVPLPAATDSADTHLVFLLDTDGGQHADDDHFLDEVYLFNDSITLDLASNYKFYDEDVADAQGSPAVLRSGSTTIATGFTNIEADKDSNDTNANAKVVFAPIKQLASDGVTYREFSVGSGQTNTMNFYVDTFSLLNTTASDDLLTPSIDLGAGSPTSANNGNIEWYDDAITNATISDSIGWVYNASASVLRPSSSLVY